MRTFLIPRDYDERWLPADQPGVCKALKKTIETLPTYPQLQLIKKRFGKKDVYTLAVNEQGQHRLIFEKVQLVMPEGKNTAYVLRGIALHHHYTSALRWTPYVTLDAADVQEQAIEYHQLVIEEDDPRTAYLYADQWVHLSGEQENIMQTKLPHIVTGPPGAGKTLVSEAFFQAKALPYLAQLQDDALELLYVSPTIKLNQAFEQAWRSWMEDSLSPEEQTKIHLTCKTFDELAQIPERPAISKNDILQEIANYLRIQRNTTLTAEAILEELYLSAYVLDADVSEQKAFATSSYQTLGAHQSRVPSEQRQIVYRIYQILVKKYHSDIPGLTLNRRLQPQYHYTCVDEIQSVRVLDLLHARAVTYHNKVLYCGDNYQRGASLLSSSALLKPYLYNAYGLDIKRTTLTETYRLMPSVAHVCHELVVLMNVLQEGKTDKEDHSRIDPALKEARASVHWVDTSNRVNFDSLGTDASIAAVVLNERDLKALQTSSRMINIFAVEQIRGLQFAKVVVYLSKETLDVFRSVSKKMHDKGIQAGQLLPVIEHGTTLKGQHDNENSTILSDLMTALSRSCGEAWVYADVESLNEKNKKRIEAFVSWLQALCKGRGSLVPKVSIPSEWLRLIHQLIDTGADEQMSLVEQARTHLLQQFNLSAESGKRYIEFYKQNRLSLEDGLKKIEEMRQEAARAEASKMLRHKAEKPQPVKLQFTQAPVPSKDIPDWAKRLMEAKNPLNLKDVCNLVYRVLQLEPALIERCLFGSSQVFEKLFFNFDSNFIKKFEEYIHERGENPLEALLPFINNKIPDEPVTYFQVMMFGIRPYYDLGEYFNLIKKAFEQATIEDLNAPLNFHNIPERYNLLYILFSHKYAPSLISDNPEIIKYKITSSGLNRKVGAEGNLLHLILDNDSCAPIWRYLIPLINKEGMACSRETDNLQDQGATPLCILCKKEKGIQFLLNNLKALTEKIDTSLFHKPAKIKGLWGSTPLYLLIDGMRSPALSNEFKLFKENWDYFKQILISDAFNQCRIIGGEFAGATLLYPLCSSTIGIELLTDYWDDFQKVMNPKSFNLLIVGGGKFKGSSPLHALFLHKEGVKLLQDHWSYFNPILMQAGMQETECQECWNTISTDDVHKVAQKLIDLNLKKLLPRNTPQKNLSPKKAKGPIKRR